MKKQLTGQYKIDPFTGKSYVVASMATERPNLEKQADLLDWASATEKLKKWKDATVPDQAEVARGVMQRAIQSGMTAVEIPSSEYDEPGIPIPPGIYSMEQIQGYLERFERDADTDGIYFIAAILEL